MGADEQILEVVQSPGPQTKPSLGEAMSPEFSLINLGLQNLTE